MSEDASPTSVELIEEAAPPAPGRCRYAPPRLTEFGDALALTRSRAPESAAGRCAAAA